MTAGRSPSARGSRVAGDSAPKVRGELAMAPESDKRPGESRTAGDLSPLRLAAATSLGEAGSVRTCAESAARAAPG